MVVEIEMGNIKIYVYIVWTDYEKFEIFLTKGKAEIFVETSDKKRFKKSGLYKTQSECLGREYNLKDFKKLSGFQIIRRRLK